MFYVLFNKWKEKSLIRASLSSYGHAEASKQTAKQVNSQQYMKKMEKSRQRRRQIPENLTKKNLHKLLQGKFHLLTFKQS